MNLPRWDQNDYRAASDALCIEATRLETTLRAAGKDVPARPAQRANLVENYEAMSAHMAQLHALISLSIARAAAPAIAPAPPAPAPAPAQTAAKKPLTPDEKILAANGVTTLNELNFKADLERGLGLRKDD